MQPTARYISTFLAQGTYILPSSKRKPVSLCYVHILIKTFSQCFLLFFSFFFLQCLFEINRGVESSVKREQILFMTDGRT